jgi:hypothetical protein
MLAEGALRKAATTATSPPASAIWTERVEIVPRRPYPAVDMYSSSGSFLGEVGLQVWGCLGGLQPFSTSHRAPGIFQRLERTYNII